MVVWLHIACLHIMSTLWKSFVAAACYTIHYDSSGCQCQAWATDMRNDEFGCNECGWMM
jgi:hypothetical protein